MCWLEKENRKIPNTFASSCRNRFKWGDALSCLVHPAVSPIKIERSDQLLFTKYISFQYATSFLIKITIYGLLLFLSSHLIVQKSLIHFIFKYFWSKRAEWKCLMYRFFVQILETYFRELLWTPPQEFMANKLKKFRTKQS